MNMLALALMLALGIDHSGRLVSPTEGGDQPAVVEEQDAPSGGSGAELTPFVETAPEPSTAICPCLGYRGRAHCYCLQRGVACKCNRTTGSEWLMKDGRPVKKTGRYANPNQQSPVASRNATRETTDDSPGADNSVPRQRSDGLWRWKHPNGRWYTSATTPTEGREFKSGDVTFVVTNGRMTLKGSQMAADITPKGHYITVRVCHGNYCTYEKRWVPE